MDTAAVLAGGFVVTGPALLAIFILRNLRATRRQDALGSAPVDADQLDPCQCCIGGLHDHSICQHPTCPAWK